MVKNTMTPTTKTDVTFEHIGAARLYNGSVRIDVKTMQAVIPPEKSTGLTELACTGLRHIRCDEERGCGTGRESMDHPVR